MGVPSSSEQPRDWGNRGRPRSRSLQSHRSQDHGREADSRRKRGRHHRHSSRGREGSRRERRGRRDRGRHGEHSRPRRRSESRSRSSSVSGHKAANTSRLTARVLKRIARDKPLPLFKGSSLSRKEQTVEGNAVLFQDYVERVLVRAEEGALSLPPDVEDASGKWVTRPDSRNEKRREILLDLIADSLDTYAKMSSQGSVTVYRVSGHTDEAPAKEVTATDWLRLLVREAASSEEAQQAAVEALDHIECSPGEAPTAAATRLVRALRASSADPDHPHTSEATYFWRYASVRTLKGLMRRFSRMILPEEVDRLGGDSLVTMHMQQMADDLSQHPVVQTHPMGTAMLARGKLTYENFIKFVTAMSTHGSRGPTQDPTQNHRKTRKHEIAPVRGENRGRFQGRGESRSEAEALIQETRDILRQLTEALCSKNTPVNEFARHLPDARKLQVALRTHETDAPQPVHMTSDATRYPDVATSTRKRSLAAIQNQAATIPGQHGVPFRRSGGAQGRSATSTPTIPAASPESNKPVPPLLTASRETISNFIRQQRVCFRHAFSVPRHGCKFSHAAIPAELYRDAHLYAQRPKPTWGQPQQRVTSSPPI